MNRPRWLLVACLAGALTACTKPTVTPPVINLYGNAGRAAGTTPDGMHVEVSATYRQQGNQLTYYVIGQLPDEDPGLSVLLLIRGSQADLARSSMGVKSQADKTYWKERLSEPGGKSFDVVYEITHKPPAEKLELGGKTYDLESGIFFLIDLTQSPVKPVQLKDKLAAQLPSHDPTEAELTSAVEKLKEKHEAVRKFLENAR